MAKDSDPISTAEQVLNFWKERYFIRKDVDDFVKTSVNQVRHGSPTFDQLNELLEQSWISPTLQYYFENDFLPNSDHFNMGLFEAIGHTFSYLASSAQIERQDVFPNIPVRELGDIYKKFAVLAMFSESRRPEDAQY